MFAVLKIGDSLNFFPFWELLLLLRVKGWLIKDRHLPLNFLVVVSIIIKFQLVGNCS